MEYLHRDQNMLFQAIIRENWPKVRSLCENEKQLINTKDEFGWTPLMRAARYEAPEDVMEKMIEAASIENIEYELDRSTILHFLAEYSYVSVLRRALERTNRNINLTDIFGRTPLHVCLLAPRSYEEHRDKTSCLMTYGASVTIKDESGKTPLDTYDDNKCTKYKESTRSSRKKELRKFIEELSVPSEILARGHDAVMAFKDAIKYGEITVVNSRMMFLGKEGSGKTSCINAMLGKGFNKNEPSTDGIVTTIVFTVGEDCSKWEEQTDIDECERAKQVHEHAIAATVAKKLTESQQIKQIEPREHVTASVASKFTDIQQMTSTSKFLPASSSEHGQAFGWFYRLFKEKSQVSPSTAEAVSTYKPIRSQVNINRIPDEIHKKIVSKLDDQSRGNSRNVGPSDVTCIWDYAGQLTYYITHRFFLTDGSAYGVVFSLVDNLDALAKPRDLHKGHFEMTNLEVIIFWIRSIYEHAVLQHGTDKKNVINGIIASPTISLIGTHKDLLPGSDIEKQAAINDIFDRIFMKINGEPYEVHVDLERYAVDNTAELDGDIERLKTNVGGYMKAMARTVPIKWVDFQTKIQEAGKNTLRMSFDKVAKIAVQCGINKENFVHVLIYLNDIGIILYSPTNKKLKNTVITNIYMLIGIFMKIITVVKPDDVDKAAPLMMKYWRKLDEEGVLAEQLVRHLWRNELTASEEDGDVIFEDFIELMKTFGLLFEKRSQGSDRVFIVPSRMNITTDNLEVKKDEEQSVSMYVTPKTFLPDAVYSVLVVKFLDLSQDKACNSDPELFANQAKIGLDNMHYLSLGVICINDKRSLKLEVTRRTEIDENGKKKPASKPRPLACMEVLHVLKHNLTDLYPSKCGVSYNLNILCPVCSVGSNQGKHHFQSLDYCLKYDSVSCGTKVMSTAGIRSLFQADLSFTKAIRNFYALQSLTIDLGTEQMRKYFMKKGQLRGKHEAGKFLLWQRQNGVLKDVDYGDQATKIFTADANIDTFDIALLMSLIQHCFSPKGDAFWEHPPDDKDTSELAYLRRIQLYKETTLDCSHSNQVTDVEFEKQWKELSTIFGGVGVSSEVVEKYRKLCVEWPMRGFEQEKVEEIRNFQVILSAVVDVGNATMREYFLEVANQGKTMQNKGVKLNKKDVGQYLIKENRKGSFKNVKIFPEQYKKMFTPTADIENFDISIMYLIIRNCCCSIPYSFWKDPDRLTNLVHIHDYRNTKLAHSPDSRMSNKVFENEWNKVRSMLHAAGASFNDIDKYKALKFMN